VSNEGIVRSLDRQVELKNGKSRFAAGRIIKPQLNNCGYLTVRINRDSKKKSFFVHRLVGLAFIPNPENFPQLNHISGVKTDNCVENLAWVNNSMNALHAHSTGLHKNNGANHNFAVGIIDNFLGKEFATVKDWCAARDINYSTGRHILVSKNDSKTIDKTQITRIERQVYGKSESAS
jgi:hypothetical protein